MDGRFFAGRKIEAVFFDGKTNYKMQARPGAPRHQCARARRTHACTLNSVPGAPRRQRRP
jgi:hypothetical protein